jgi:hypothetical protein
VHGSIVTCLMTNGSAANAVLIGGGRDYIRIDTQLAIRTGKGYAPARINLFCVKFISPALNNVYKIGETVKIFKAMNENLRISCIQQHGLDQSSGISGKDKRREMERDVLDLTYAWYM